MKLLKSKFFIFPIILILYFFLYYDNFQSKHILDISWFAKDLFKYIVFILSVLIFILSIPYNARNIFFTTLIILLIYLSVTPQFKNFFEEKIYNVDSFYENLDNIKDKSTLKIINTKIKNKFKLKQILKVKIQREYYRLFLIIAGCILPFLLVYTTLLSDKGIIHLNSLGTIIFLGTTLLILFLLLKIFTVKYYLIFIMFKKIFSSTSLIPIFGFEFPLLIIIFFVVSFMCMFFFIDNKYKYQLPFYYLSMILLFSLFQVKNGRLYLFNNSNYLYNLSFFINFINLFILIYVVSLRKAYRDDLTQVLNRRALNENFEKLTSIRKYSLIMIDIDYFKKFNDTYGHDNGDIVLRKIADILDKKSSGKVFRFGGEEFTIIYIGKNIEKVYKEIDEIRKYISKYKISLVKQTKKGNTEKKTKVNISAGVAEKTMELKDATQVLKEADNKLYLAKKNGRNRVEK